MPKPAIVGVSGGDLGDPTEEWLRGTFGSRGSSQKAPCVLDKLLCYGKSDGLVGHQGIWHDRSPYIYADRSNILDEGGQVAGLKLSDRPQRIVHAPDGVRIRWFLG